MRFALARPHPPAHPCCACVQLSCLDRCKHAAAHAYRGATAKCGRRAGSRRKACEQVVAAEHALSLSYCFASNLPTRCRRY